MKKNQIIAIVGSLIVGLGVGYASAYNLQEGRMEQMKRASTMQTTALMNEFSKLSIKELVTVGEEITTDEQKARGEKMYGLTDGSWFIINEMENKYIFQPIDLGDWDYELNSSKELNNIVNTYIEMKNNGTW